MTASRTLAAGIVVALGLGGGVALAQGSPPDRADGGVSAEARATAFGAAAAAMVAQDLVAQAEAEDDDEAGEPQGRGTEAFAARHAAIAERLRDKPGAAAAVHDALSRGESPAGVGRAHAESVRAANEARRALGGAGGK
jgi:hypothetical protein